MKKQKMLRSNNHKIELSILNDEQKLLFMKVIDWYLEDIGIINKKEAFLKLLKDDNIDNIKLWLENMANFYKSEEESLMEQMEQVKK